jgi:hypothetical protein
VYRELTLFTNGTAAARAPVAIPPPVQSRGGCISDLLFRIRSEYDEMPGLCLTREQAQRLWGLEEDACEAVLSALVLAGYLKTTHGGAYIRC